MTPARLAVTAAAIALAGLGTAACGSRTGTAAGRPAPQKLDLSAYPAPRPAAGATGQPVIVMPPAPTGAAGAVTVELRGTLPRSGPASGRIETLPGGQVAPATVTALAAALHVTGPLQRVSDGWRSRGTGLLQVSDAPGQRWTFTQTLVPPCPAGLPRPGGAGAASSEVASVAARGPAAAGMDCPVLPGGTEPFEPVPGAGAPSPSAAMSAARPVLAAAGVTAARLSVTTAGSQTFVSADPDVGGLQTSGLTTTIGVAAGPRIVQAGGWLSRPSAGASYPLVSALAAFDRLASSARRAIGHAPLPMCPRKPDLLCELRTRTVIVTGAVYGLALSYDKGQPVLVPSWLMQVRGSSQPIAQIAVDPRYITG